MIPLDESHDNQVVGAEEIVDGEERSGGHEVIGASQEEANGWDEDVSGLNIDDMRLFVGNHDGEQPHDLLDDAGQVAVAQHHKLVEQAISNGYGC